MVFRTFERRLGYGKRPAYVSLLVEQETQEPFGAMLTWFSGPYECSPQQHLASGGHDFRRIPTTEFLDDGTLGKSIGEIETDPESILALRKLLTEWQLAL